MPEPESFIKNFNKRFKDTIGIIAPKKEKLINLICSKKQIFYVCFFAFKKIEKSLKNYISYDKIKYKGMFPLRIWNTCFNDLYLVIEKTTIGMKGN